MFCPEITNITSVPILQLPFRNQAQFEVITQHMLLYMLHVVVPGTTVPGSMCQNSMWTMPFATPRWRYGAQTRPSLVIPFI
jgi:hypothetical protein